MAGVSEYLLRITAAAVLCAIVKLLIGKQGFVYKLIHFITGVFLSVILISPLVNIRMEDFQSYIDSYSLDGRSVSDAGEEKALQAMEQIIIEQTQAYILDEAQRLGADLSVEVKLTGSDPPVPDRVIISGQVSPYKRTVLSRYISENIGISKENQQWN